MTEISQLVARIGIEPAYLSQIDWKEETNWFSKERIKQIITRIEDNRTCNLVVEYIVNNWYLACLEDPFDFYSNRSLMEQISWAGDEWDWRFCNSQSEPSFKYESSIEKFVTEVCGIREEMLIRKQSLKDLDDKAKQLKKEKPKVFYEEDGEVFEVNGEDVIMFHLDRQNRWMKEELDACEKKISSLENDYKDLEEKYKKETSEWNEKMKILEKDTKKAFEEIKREAIRELVENIIARVERFPHTQNDRAKVVKEVIRDEIDKGHIPAQTLTEGLRSRLSNLGEKDPNLNVSAESFFKVTGNQEVNIGGR